MAIVIRSGGGSRTGAWGLCAGEDAGRAEDWTHGKRASGGLSCTPDRLRRGDLELNWRRRGGLSWHGRASPA
jgi:hypothetical protein